MARAPAAVGTVDETESGAQRPPTREAPGHALHRHTVTEAAETVGTWGLQHSGVPTSRFPLPASRAQDQLTPASRRVLLRVLPPPVSAAPSSAAVVALITWKSRVWRGLYK